MITKLERNTRLYSVLRVLEDAYETGEFADFVELLTDDCVYESMWVLEPLRGRDAVSTHLLKKGQSIKGSNAFPKCWIAELVGNMNPLPEANVTVNGEAKRADVALYYEAGKYCLMMEQQLDGKKNDVLLDLRLTEDGKVSRIDLCIPDLFQKRGLTPSIAICPAKGENTNEEAMILIGYPYFSEIYAFLDLADQGFDEYDDVVIPMQKWQKALEYWSAFASADDYDAVVEELFGIDYASWVVNKEDVYIRFRRNGLRLWRDRKLNSTLLQGLQEWTRKYCKDYDFIYTYGY